MSDTFHHVSVELHGIPGATLGDHAGLSGLALAAAGAVGLSPHDAPIARSGPRGIVVALLCHGGHVVLHALPEQNRCLVELTARAPAPVQRGVDVIAKRLGTTSPA